MKATYETIVYPELEKVRQAARRLISVEQVEIATILTALADLTENEIPFLLKANKEDLSRMDKEDPKYDRLLLTEERILAIASDLRKVAALPSPLDKVLEERELASGLLLKRVSVPLGVVGIIFESRPNVTFDVFALCLKSGNAAVLKGSRDAHYSNQAILQLIKTVLAPYDLGDSCYLAPSEREALPAILQADQYIDVIIPRGSQGLIKFVRENARVPVIETGAGIVHTYLDKTASITKAKAIITNAKARRVSVCNALDCVLVHEEIADQLPFLLSELGEIHQCRVLADEKAYAILTGPYPQRLLAPADANSFGTEFLSMQLAVKIVSDVEEALDHIAKYSSKHSEAIIAEDEATCEYFLKQVDAAVVYANTTTAFTDGGQFGMGAEIGISTQKLHARGPMALRELTSYKWIVKGNGQIRN
ncbi:glutamate-5-semialdehyde dehydrogenase [Lewinella sp. LCG006]|uniref:glutamate-5-semialdehyde dehydrogenase n=1 Tax=Lewinella sp. LCG006 TaxID=3231911 RepID=UPI00345FE8DA